MELIINQYKNQADLYSDIELHSLYQNRVLKLYIYLKKYMTY